MCVPAHLHHECGRMYVGAWTWTIINRNAALTQEIYRNTHIRACLHTFMRMLFACICDACMFPLTLCRACDVVVVSFAYTN